MGRFKVSGVASKSANPQHRKNSAAVKLFHFSLVLDDLKKKSLS